MVARSPLDLPEPFTWSELLASARTTKRKAKKQWLALSPGYQAGLTALGAGTLTAVGLYGHRRFWRRIRTAGEHNRASSTGVVCLAGPAAAVDGMLTCWFSLRMQIMFFRTC